MKALPTQPTPPAVVVPLPPQVSTPEAVAPAEVPAPPAPVATAWPTWFGPVDRTLALAVLVVAFLAASFAARNSDVWLSLASGRAVVQGKWLGADPFTWSAGNRPWVQPAWLTDLAAYGTFSLDATGALLVGLKALLFAAAFGLVGTLRRPGESPLPWAVLGAMGVLASAPQAALRPAVVSLTLLGVLLALLGRLNWSASRWREPVIVAGVVALWANCDAGFWLGPVVLAAVTLGGYLERFLPRPAGDAPAGGAVPLPALVKTLGLSLVACLLNPTLLAGLAKDPGEAFAQLLPFELGFGVPGVSAADADMTAQLTLQPLSADYYDAATRGASLSGGCLALLAVAGAAGLALNFRRLRATPVVLWAVALIVGLQHVRYIPYFALIAVPVAARQWGDLFARVRPGPVGDPNTRIVLTGAVMARVLGGVGALALLLLAYPGWLHPIQPNPAAQRRVEWAVTPEPGLARSARLVERGRADGTLPAGSVGVTTSVEFGDYAAWFAPAERSFVNGRFAFHRAELPDLLAARRAFLPASWRTQEDAAAALAEVNRVCAERRADYLAAATTGVGRPLDLQAVFALANGERSWAVWHLDGRLGLLGRFGGSLPDGAVRARLFDPARLAFAPDQEPLPVTPEGTPAGPQVPGDYLVNALARPHLPGPDADDARVYALYGRYVGEVSQGLFEGAQRHAGGLGALLGGPALEVGRRALKPPLLDERIALPILTLRAARRAAALSPDQADSYAVLAEAYAPPALAPVIDAPAPELEVPERQLQLLSALRHALERMPGPGDGTVQAQLRARAFALQLRSLLIESGQFDTAKELFDVALAYEAKLSPEALVQSFNPPPGTKQKDVVERLAKQNDDQRDALLTEIQARQKGIALFRQENQGLLRRLVGTSDAAQRLIAARAVGLPSEALRLYEATADPADFGPGRAEVELQVAGIYARTGRPEFALEHLGKLQQPLEDLAQRSRGEAQLLSQRALRVQLVAQLLVGNPEAAQKAFPAASFPPVAADFDPAQARALPGVEAVSVLVGAHASAVGLMAEARVPLFARPVAAANAQRSLLQEAAYYHERGNVALQQGEIGEAKYFFQQALKPQGVDLAPLGDAPRAELLRRYLDLIDRASRPPARP